MRKEKEKLGLEKFGSRDEIAHELRTPLVSVQGYLEMMIRGQLGALNEEQQRGMEIALRNCERLRDYINGLLEAIKEEHA